MRPVAFVLVALALLQAAAPVLSADAATATPVLLERTDAGHLVADAGRPAAATFSLFNLNKVDDFYVSAVVTAPDGWTANVSPNQFFLTPRATANVTVTLSPVDEPRATASFDVTFSLVHGTTGAVTKVAQTVEVASAAPPRILGLFRNPLGPPLDNQYGTFAIDLVVWTAVAFLAIAIGDAVVRAMTARASGAVTREIATKLRKPIFYVVVAFGLAQSLAVLPRNGVIVFVEHLLLGVVVGLFGLFVVYKVLDAALFYYQQEIAPKTETKIDDVLVPVIRKVGVVVLWGAGVILALKTLGWDPTIIFAGAGIAGLVIAFAAQDTFSNLFSGVFLMIDRPFVEGDVIVLETGEIARVQNIGLRTTQLYEYDHHHIITVPNNQLATRRITNYSAPDSFFKVDIFVGVGYDADPAKVTKALLETAAGEPELVHDAPWGASVQLRDFADSAMTFMLRVTLKDPRDKNRVPSKLRAAIKKRFDAEGIEIPFPQRVVHVKTGAL